MSWVRPPLPTPKNQSVSVSPAVSVLGTDQASCANRVLADTPLCAILAAVRPASICLMAQNICASVCLLSGTAPSVLALSYGTIKSYSAVRRFRGAGQTRAAQYRTTGWLNGAQPSVGSWCTEQYPDYGSARIGAKCAKRRSWFFSLGGSFTLVHRTESICSANVHPDMHILWSTLIAGNDQNCRALPEQLQAGARFTER